MIDDPRCRACRSKKREEIDRGLRAGRSVREIGEQYGIPKSAIGRHKSHVEPAAIDTKAELAKVDALLEETLQNRLRTTDDVYAAGLSFRDAYLRMARALMSGQSEACR